MIYEILLLNGMSFDKFLFIISGKSYIFLLYTSKKMCIIIYDAGFFSMIVSKQLYFFLGCPLMTYVQKCIELFYYVHHIIALLFILFVMCSWLI